jgi:soluble lytic murein transglycosylase-like protein
MSKRRSLLQPVAILSCAMLLSAAAVAQGVAPVQEDVFASVHQSLNDAADRTLALAFAEKSWMRARDVEATAGEYSSDIESNDPVAKVRAAVARVNQLRPAIEPILQDEGVPPDLSAVVLVESGGLIDALSPKGARGIWQFMPATARRYGLTVSGDHDDRLDISKSTRAAARLLRDLHRNLGDWQLTIAAYNAGEQAVERAVDRIGQKDFSGIERELPQETRNYVPAVIAAVNRLQGHRLITPTRIIYASVGPSN